MAAMRVVFVRVDPKVLVALGCWCWAPSHHRRDACCRRVWVCVGGRSRSTVGGGFKNVASAYNSFVGGGGARTADNLGGNVASGSWSAVLGGSFNTANGV